MGAGKKQTQWEHSAQGRANDSYLRMMGGNENLEQWLIERERARERERERNNMKENEKHTGIMTKQPAEEKGDDERTRKGESEKESEGRGTAKKRDTHPHYVYFVFCSVAVIMMAGTCHIFKELLLELNMEDGGSTVAAGASAAAAVTAGAWAGGSGMEAMEME